MFIRIIQLFCTLVLVAGLIGCGNTGELYLPQDESTVQQTNPENSES
jgi:predicted small lipoprotein YifL